MPRKPSKHSNLRNLRKVLGLSQVDFAQLLNVSRNTILKIENGQMKLPVALAYKCKLATGCDLRLGDKSQGESKLDICLTYGGGKPYSVDCFKAAQAYLLASSGNNTDVETQLLEMLRTILDKAKQDNVSKLVYQDLHAILASTMDEYGCGNQK